MQDTLSDLTLKIANGSIKIVDLTQTLHDKLPVLQLPQQFGQCESFKKTLISEYDEKGPGWYWNNFVCGEHTGTHLDAPVHWVTGKHYEQGSVDTLPLKQFVAPASVIDFSKQVAKTEDAILTPEFLEQWEKENGEIPAGNWVLLRTDWYKRTDPALFVNRKEDGLCHTPGPNKAAIQFLIKRNVLGIGVETINTDAGISFTWEFKLPCHTLMHGAGKSNLQMLMNLDQLPTKGAVIIATPLKIQKGSGSPVRVIALVQN